jgi:hypothetical protein
MWYRVAFIVSVICFIIFNPAQALAQSIAASPGKIIADNVALGEKTFLHEVEIINDSDSDHAYSIFTKKPGILKEGYEEIPDPGWIEIDRIEIEIEAQSRESVEVWVRMPNNEAVANKKYEGWVVAREEAGGMVAVQVAVRVLLSTSDYNPSLPEEAVSEQSTPAETLPEPPSTQATPSEPSISPQINVAEPPETSETSEFPILQLAGIIAGAAIIITLIITFAWRRRY